MFSRLILYALQQWRTRRVYTDTDYSHKTTTAELLHRARVLKPGNFIAGMIKPLATGTAVRASVSPLTVSPLTYQSHVCR
jgi:hypothetical protein